jgi:hypothetical protein
MNNIALWRTPAVGYTKTVEIGRPLFAGESLSDVHYALIYETRLELQRSSCRALYNRAADSESGVVTSDGFSIRFKYISTKFTITER